MRDDSAGVSHVAAVAQIHDLRVEYLYCLVTLLMPHPDPVLFVKLSRRSLHQTLLDGREFVSRTAGSDEYFRLVSPARLGPF